MPVKGVFYKLSDPEKRGHVVAFIVFASNEAEARKQAALRGGPFWLTKGAIVEEMQEYTPESNVGTLLIKEIYRGKE